MKIKLILLILVLEYSMVVLAQYPSEYNVVWNSPSAGSHESMPCGGGSVGTNVWVENGDILFYFSHSGTFDEHNAFLKGGRIRIHLAPNPFLTSVFRQELRLNDGCVEISGGEGEKQSKVVLWIDVFRPVVHVEIESQQKIDAEVSLESWRFEDFTLRKDESHANSYKFAPPAGLEVTKDVINFEDNSVCFYHRNPEYTVFDVAVERQGMAGVKNKMMNPLANLTFGGMLTGKSFISKGTYEGEYAGTRFKGWTLKSSCVSQRYELKLYLHNEQTEILDEWKAGLQKLVTNERKTEKQNKSATREWWHQFWERSFIRIDSEKQNSEPWKIGRNYQLFRYMLACNAYGSEPTKFNGGLFTFDPVHVDSTRAFTPDFRLWGGGTMTAQNQRLVYFPMLKSGDFDMMYSQFNFYERMLHNAELRSMVYWGHDGACFTEQIEQFGLPNISEYAWQPHRLGMDRGVESNPWLEYTWDTVLEFDLMMLDAYDYNQEPIRPHLPFIESTIRFFDEHYRYVASKRGTMELDGDGHWVLYPGSAAETYKMATNATSTVAALKTVLCRLLALPESETTEKERNRWKELQKRVPPLNICEIDGKRMLAPAKMWERVNNEETPQLYPVFPWRIYGVGRPDLKVAVNTYLYDPKALKFRSHRGWKQDNIWAACLGLVEEARSLTLRKMGDGPHRFPSFWGPGFDWTPDHNWGGSGMIGVQEMLIQTVGDSILLFPAWPEEWDVHFKLHAPKGTVVEVEYRDGKVIDCQVTPAARLKNVVFFNKHLNEIN